jgi:hypothetical protein
LLAMLRQVDGRAANHRATSLTQPR